MMTFPSKDIPMKTITLSDMDAQIIVDALRFKTAVLINELLHQEPTTITVAPKEVTPKVTSKVGFRLKKDGTLSKPLGRPRK
jgi:hypothetical protein